MLRKQILRLGSKEMFLNQVKNTFVSQTHILLPRRVFPSLATQTMCPSLARPGYPRTWLKTLSSLLKT